MPPNLVIRTLAEIWRELARQDVSACLVGGLSLPIWNYPRSTQDIDLLLLLEDELQLKTICDHLQCRPRRTPAIVELGSVRVMQTQVCPSGEYIDIDVDFLLSSSDFHSSVVVRAITVDFESIETPIRVATCEDLILLKLQSGRMIDLADCQRLIEVNTLLDWDYIHHWSDILQVANLLHQVRSGQR